ncbi:hypothetical protein COCSUDRAFT_67659 [Coccomyxa subellipsoidea C-169]|uniref:Uncharacterized protein n=1 Tax=Coccomyxa subellipsoidea (strain C-169) TaxID=574566 RepID=I0YNM0_COCSC|nr:hypothetical protein COCSUDRAFT_67659 [Coccomyxa subellipsoidea C-169]EIE19989.1 hypothetical protein COCSUDRAFT_67659 [Coccomyxa subellipsoidea C-169]|eukprot:XP_005644533.1 hypothetical protein COCSUDRAFT_67659 [Coccomyxa subellipsoidea C-169]
MFDLFKSHEPETPKIPASIVAILAFGFVISAYILRIKPFSRSANGAWDFSSLVVIKTRWGAGSPIWLFLYRLALLIWCFGLGVSHTVSVGPYIFAYFTMWTWWLLTSYFLIATIASYRSLRQPKTAKQTVDRLEFAVIAVLHVAVAGVLMVDTLTWLVLVPMLRSNPDAAKVRWAEKMFFNFYSYNTHGANMAFILGELFLNSIPFVPYLMGYLGIYVATFGLWSFTYFRLMGLWLYPFLDANQPWAVLAYGGIFAGCFAFVGLVSGLFWLRDWLALGTKRTIRATQHLVEEKTS